MRKGSPRGHPDLLQLRLRFLRTVELVVDTHEHAVVRDGVVHIDELDAGLDHLLVVLGSQNLIQFPDFLRELPVRVVDSG